MGQAKSLYIFILSLEFVSPMDYMAQKISVILIKVESSFTEPKSRCCHKAPWEYPLSLLSQVLSLQYLQCGCLYYFNHCGQIPNIMT